MLGRKAAGEEIVPSGQALNMVSDVAWVAFSVVLYETGLDMSDKLIIVQAYLTKGP